MRLEAADLSRLLSSVAALEAGPVPARLSFDLAREPGRWRLDGLEGALAGAPVSGAIVLEGGAPARLTGTLSTETLSVPRLLGLWGARTTGDAGPAPWSAARFATASPPPVGFSLDLKAKRIDLSDLYAVTDGRLRLATEPQGIEVRDLTGRFGGGALSGLLTLRRRGDMVAAEGRLFLENVDSAAILAPLAARAAPGGRVTLAVDVLGTGRSPLMILQSLSGQGTLSVRDLVLPGADPAAIGAVLADTGTGAPPDERRTAQMFDRALQRAPLRLEQVEAAFGIVNGTVRLSPARGGGAPCHGAGSHQPLRQLRHGADASRRHPVTGSGGCGRGRSGRSDPVARSARHARTSRGRRRAGQCHRHARHRARNPPAGRAPRPPAIGRNLRSEGAGGCRAPGAGIASGAGGSAASGSGGSGAARRQCPDIRRIVHCRACPRRAGFPPAGAAQAGGDAPRAACCARRTAARAAAGDRALCPSAAVAPGTGRGSLWTPRHQRLRHASPPAGPASRRIGWACERRSAAGAASPASLGRLVALQRGSG